MSFSPAPVLAQPSPSFREFVALMAMLIALTALGIDFLLPAFPPIAADLAIPYGNDLQYLVYGYMLGLAASQLFYGPLSDALGRRPVLMVGIVIYLGGCLLAAFAESFAVLVAARVVQGMGAGAARVLPLAIVRDRYDGRAMSEVMSFIIMVFIAVPIFAPALGSLVLFFGNWQFIFVTMFLFGVTVLLWSYARLPETLHPEYRLPLSARRILEATRFCLSQRVTIGYTTIISLLMGCLMGYVGSSQQIFAGDVYHLGDWFALAFGLLALAIGLGSLLNALLVQRFGMRRLLHSALLGAMLASLAMMFTSWMAEGKPSLFIFGPLLALFNFSFSLAMPNANALAMHPLGAVAGTASSLIGLYTTLAGTLLGLMVGQAFDGTVLPLSLSFFVLSAASLLTAFWTEKGRLFQQQSPEHVPEKLHDFSD